MKALALIGGIAVLACLPGQLGAEGLTRQDATAPVLNCGGAEHLAHTEAVLRHVAEAVHGAQVKIVVVGSGSSALAPQAGLGAAYPARLQQALASHWPQVRVTVAVEVQARQTAANMREKFDSILAVEKPALIVWQTGTVDALRGVNPEEFRATLEEGVEHLRSAGVDVVLINMQYSPRTESMIHTEAYLDGMRAVAMQQEVPLFDRFGIMKQWNELGVFDLSITTREYRQATRVHECLGRLLADVIVESSQAAGSLPVAKEAN